jgi:hypothetical protein
MLLKSKFLRLNLPVLRLPDIVSANIPPENSCGTYISSVRVAAFIKLKTAALG